MTPLRSGINLVENENTLVVQKYLGLVVEYLEKGKLHSSSGPRVYNKTKGMTLALNGQFSVFDALSERA